MQFENAANHNLSVLPGKRLPGKLFDLFLQLVRQKYRLYEVLTPQTL